jgi:hypothetical protein
MTSFFNSDLFVEVFQTSMLYHPVFDRSIKDNKYVPEKRTVI